MPLLKKITRAAVLQPVLTIILVILLGALIFQFTNGRFSSSSGLPSYREVSKTVSFDNAVDKFLDGSYSIYTQGSLIVKNNTEQLKSDNKSLQPSPTDINAAEKVIKATENKYDNLFFFVDRGVVKKLDHKSYSQNESLFLNSKNEIIYMSNLKKEYIVYPEPENLDENNSLVYQSTKQIFYDLMPLISIIKDYKEGKFIPVERATNLYSGKWKHPIFTSNDVNEIFIETDPTNGNFRSLSIVHPFSSVPSQIFFNFKPETQSVDLDTIPQGYKQIQIPISYKIKS
jgi:hypothetical protein